jgi:hypothetical protein
MMAAATGTVKGEFQAISFRSTGPVVCNGVNIEIVDEVTGAGRGLDHEKLEEITVGQVTIDTLSCKTLGILAAVDRLLPGRPKRCHYMAADTKGVGIGSFNHKAGCQHRYNC